MATEKEIVRGYVKWTDDDGVFHKEPLSDHADLLAKATPEQQIRAEEARRLNEAAEVQVEHEHDEDEKDMKDTLEALKKAPEEVHTAAELEAAEPASAAEEPVKDDSAGAKPSDQPLGEPSAH